MIDKELIDRINTLAHKQKVEGLTNEELVEQKKLRQEYLKQFKNGLRQTLDNVKVVDEKGNDITPSRKGNA